jgi:hypothetical protein
MPSRVSCGLVRSWSKLASLPFRAVARLCWMFLAAVGAAFGAPKPKLLRHEDPIVQVAEEDAAER